MNLIYIDLTLQSLLSIHHLALTYTDFQTSSLTHLNKTSHYHPQVLLQLTIQNQVLCIQNPRYLISTLSPPSHPHFHFLHHCIHIYIEELRGYDTPLSHPTIYRKLLTLTPFYSDTG